MSTGGFTDCLLQYGASFVYGVDVGYGQVTSPDLKSDSHKASFLNFLLLVSTTQVKVPSHPIWEAERMSNIHGAMLVGGLEHL